MRRLICRVLRHKWELVWKAQRPGVFDAMRCTRCNEMGWQT